MNRKIIIIGCLTTASFFVACNQASTEQESADKTAIKDSSQKSDALEMYESSELADLMRSMYEDNLAMGEEIKAGKLPTSFPEDFYKIHQAKATPGMLHDTTFFNKMAEEYLANLKKITEAENPHQAKIAYNDMVMTCAGCHQVYCQGPLPKIRRMKLSLHEPTGSTN
ncbi:MAG: cytochrome c [Owenweeksia sp.]|nr:cytochrome c [Owenweeksia sp.]